MTSSSSETGHVTGTKDKDYNVIGFTEVCLSNVLRLQTYIQDAAGPLPGRRCYRRCFRSVAGPAATDRSGP